MPIGRFINQWSTLVNCPYTLAAPTSPQWHYCPCTAAEVVSRFCESHWVRSRFEEGTAASRTKPWDDWDEAGCAWGGTELEIVRVDSTARLIDNLTRKWLFILFAIRWDVGGKRAGRPSPVLLLHGRLVPWTCGRPKKHPGNRPLVPIQAQIRLFYRAEVQWSLVKAGSSCVCLFLPGQ